MNEENKLLGYCKWCNKPIYGKHHNKLIAHQMWCKLNPKSKQYHENAKDYGKQGAKKFKENLAKNKPQIKDFVLTCKFCGKEYTVQLTEKQFAKKHFKPFCSRTCSAKYSASYVKSENISKGMNKTHILKCFKCGKDIEKKINVNRALCDECKKLEYNVKKTCVICKKDFIAKYKNVQTCSKECTTKLRTKNFSEHQKITHTCGGKRHGSGRGKKGWYKGFYCDSSWELAWVIYSLDHNVVFKRNTKYFEYEFENKLRKYFPDFILEDGTYVEIKGYQTEQWNAKYKQISSRIKLQVLTVVELQPIFEYVKTKYGIDWITLYDGSKPEKKDLSKQKHVWIHNSEKNTWILVKDLQKYLDEGWIIGRKKFK